jgi:surface polysaccharide O-acyltransferase-like enzyme
MKKVGIEISNERIVEMDIIRAIATIAVVLIHVTATILYRAKVNSYIFIVSMFINQLSRFSVPAFIMLSGIGLTVTYKKRSYISFLYRRLNKIIPRYLIWCLIYIFFINKSYNVYNDCKDVVFGTVFYHLYFVPLIIQFYIIFPLVYNFIGRKWTLLITFLMTLGILIGLHYSIFSSKLVWFFDRRNMIDWIFYFSFGCFIGNNKEKFKNIMYKYKVIIMVAFAGSIYLLIKEAFVNTKTYIDIDFATTFLRPSVIVYTIFLILFIFSINWKEGVLLKAVQYISRNSYGIYLSHAFILYYYTQYYLNRSMSVSNFQFGITAFAITFLGAIIINESRRLP